MGQQGSKGPKITAQDRAILDLKLQRDKIKQYQKKLSIGTERENALAKEALARGDRDKARTALRRRKYQESLLSKTDGQLETLEGLVSTIEFAQIEQAVLHGLKQGNEVLKDIHRVMKIESVEKLMEETAEAQAAQREIDEMLSSQMTAEEEEAVMKELEEIEKEQQALMLQEEGDEDAVLLPSAPKTKLIQQESQQQEPAPVRERAQERQQPEAVLA
ncbi:Snf7-domain-containing protein [Tilletiaria anomala UBC 951]|uniref:Snf7-domain-containing protein n=1 Tax=Tilletiaria anomala (strain ATCC 24038 / CBS 436.72 / UBC 951) TaxID=1037660 RepID=A0A066WP43_TILAU|nr:Snf7-domain-containing protein [Tilletiaria anomala UBC 951]KDN52789.1 Snf7-domain-containing protein [Tilletiaria anomala UBC 951]